MRINEFTIIEFVASGGNGQVWKVQDTKNQFHAIKFLTKIKKRGYQRFLAEVEVMQNNSETEGILPIISFHLPEDPISDIPYFIMPLADQILPVLKNKSPIEIVKYLIEVADTLSILHSKSISHRDIKPSNLLFYNGRIYISDFGLVDFPDKKDLTEKGETIGPKWTMAPEMRRNADSADGKKADSYSFAKSLWILLTKEIKGFDGQYSPESSLSLNKYIKLSYYKTLDDLLIECTDNDPNKRKTISEISVKLKEWLEIERNYKSRNKLQWKDIQKQLFPSTIPTRAFWEDNKAIVDILNILSNTSNLNHVFFPTGGGNDLHGARLSHEKNCIELNFGQTVIVKPKRLVFESFGFQEEWNYFRLECNHLAACGYYPDAQIRETVTELAPLIYTDYNCGEFNDFDGEELPDDARLVERFLSECSFVIFQKTSLYNKVSSTYDARHNKKTTDEFRAYIDKTVRMVNPSNSNDTCLNQIQIVIPKTYRSKKRLLSPTELQLLNQIIALAKECDFEDKKINAKLGMQNGLEFSANDMFKSFIEPRPKDDEMVAFLQNLTNDEITLVAAVMYGGRDGNSPLWGTPLDELVEYFKNDKDLVSTISEKVLSLEEYLNRGIKLYSL